MKPQHRRVCNAIHGFVIKRGERGATATEIQAFVDGWMPKEEPRLGLDVWTQGRIRDLVNAGLIEQAYTGLVSRKIAGAIWVARPQSNPRSTR